MGAAPRDRSTQPPGGRGGAGEAPPSFWEWVVAAIGLVLLLASLAYLLHAGWAGDGRSPVPLVRVAGIEAQEGRWLVRVRVFNQGGSTAAALRLEGELRRGEEVVERSELEFEHVPAQSSRAGGLFFERDPRQLRLHLVVRSYQEP